MSTSPEEPPTGSSGATDHADPAVIEPLACTSCRSRKLKCDRHKPICTRCAKVNGECVYPESRRKPAFKRRNVKELEERLAQVEGFLKNAGKHARVDDPVDDSPDGIGDIPMFPPTAGTGVGSELNDMFFTSNFADTHPDPVLPHAFQSQGQQHSSNSSSESPEGSGFGHTGGELFGLGRFESLPPFEMIEDLHNIFFETQQSFIPLIHRTRYLQAFYATAPHVRPPMCLQYAIWAMAANGHEKYGRFYDIFYRRARQYLENDELKGYGEQFVTLAHAQAWALIGTSEARCMHFTKASMSSARCIRLVGMMGFHRLDDPSKEDNPIHPTIDPPKDLTDLEERRRVFWGAFCMDAHASISTGWPGLVDLSQVTTHLPCSEDAFNNATYEKTATLKAALGGFQYSTFAATIITCHIFVKLLKHVHRPLPDDCPDDYEHGKYWMRHRELDNILSSSFMFLPERFRLPKHGRDPVAMYQNLNLHASVICLHNSASDKVDKYKLPFHIKQSSRMRCLTSAYEIVNIMKMTANNHARTKTPLVALSLYCAASVFLCQAKENPEKADTDSLTFLVQCMENIGRQHIITRAYFNHLVLDIQYNGIDTGASFLSTAKIQSTCGYSIPLLARSSISFRSEPQPPLPLGRPHPPLDSDGHCLCGGITPEVDAFPPPAEKVCNIHAPSSKRKRTTGPSGRDAPAQRPFEQNAPSTPDFWTNLTGAGGASSSSARPVRLPHRGNTPLPSTNTAPPPPPTNTQESLLRFAMASSSSSEFLFERTVAPSELLTTPANLAATDITSANLFQELDDAQWDGVISPRLFSQMAAAMMGDSENTSADDGLSNVASGGESDAWRQLLSGAGVDAGGADDVWGERGGGG
ncbi:hypothetical protein B0T16DRAFT_148662 [Cercophora newfieldiana]|uniref:Zn(2)-C6 fungal-type domain-containing protein n=1 Tax=Cercophora newfieldiana TaxID=92897 RepID=A0AA40CNX7_9PEZI|nr:hypothetical protein B0T16DRAFT_148662 [Cercophora newfieldiana]